MLLEKIDEAISKAQNGKLKEVITLLEQMRELIDDDSDFDEEDEYDEDEFYDADVDDDFFDE